MMPPMRIIIRYNILSFMSTFLPSMSVISVLPSAFVIHILPSTLVIIISFSILSFMPTFFPSMFVIFIIPSILVIFINWTSFSSSRIHLHFLLSTVFRSLPIISVIPSLQMARIHVSPIISTSSSFSIAIVFISFS
ncbi:hypothetical protein HKD37_19G052441 [Glycine soja]